MGQQKLLSGQLLLACLLLAGVSWATAGKHGKKQSFQTPESFLKELRLYPKAGPNNLWPSTSLPATDISKFQILPGYRLRGYDIRVGPDRQASAGLAVHQEEVAKREKQLELLRSLSAAEQSQLSTAAGAQAQRKSACASMGRSAHRGFAHGLGNALWSSVQAPAAALHTQTWCLHAKPPNLCASANMQVGPTNFTSVEQCAAFCLATPNCKAFTYHDEHEVAFRPNSCWVKASIWPPWHHHGTTVLVPPAPALLMNHWLACMVASVACSPCGIGHDSSYTSTSVNLMRLCTWIGKKMRAPLNVNVSPAFARHADLWPACQGGAFPVWPDLRRAHPPHRMVPW